MKRIIFLVTFLLVSGHTMLYAGNHIGVGLHAGYHYDVGNLASRTDMRTEPQQNLLAGVTLKIDVHFLFLRVGGTKSFMLWRGKTLDDSQELSSINIQYTAIPVHVGFNFPIHDRGRFYMGIGGAYVWITGDISTQTEKQKLGIGIFGHGFIAGIQLRVSEYVMTCIEWEYFSGKTRPQADASSSHEWNDFDVDLTGNRYYISLLYYII